MTIKTVRMKASQITKDWHVIDAAGRPLGRVASEAAILLRGKHKPTFEPHLDGGDFVIVINASQVRLSGRKAEQKTYYRHSGYPGGLKSRTFPEQLSRFPDKVIQQAVWGMLPDGPLGKQMLKHLKVYGGPTHPHASQVTGSERAIATREAAIAEMIAAPRTAPRLRPLAVPQMAGVVGEFPPAEAATVATAPSAKATPVAEPAALPADESPAATEAVLEPEAVAEAPKPKRTRKKAEATEPTAEEPATSDSETEE